MSLKSSTLEPSTLASSDRKRVDLAIRAVEDTKGQDVMVFDMDNRSSITDWVLVCSGRSQAHVRGIADRVEKDLKEMGVRCSTMEGYQEGSWILMDFDVFLVHVFHPETRAYYDLEDLLKDFPCQRYGESSGGEFSEEQASSPAG